MGWFSTLYQRIEQTEQELFAQAKKQSVMATTAVDRARAELEAKIQAAADLAEQTRITAEAAANRAAKDAANLAIEARAAAEAAAYHRSQLTPPQEPTL